MKTTRRVGVVALVVVAITLLLTGQAGAATATVSMVDNDFVPPTVTVTQGDTVHWVHNGLNSHTVDADDASFISPILGTGQTFDHVFNNAPGTMIPYHCRFHGAAGGLGMAGVIVVGTGGTTARYTPLTPARILDTRNGTGGVSTLGSGATALLQVAGQGGVPATGVTAVAMNVTVTNPTAAQSFLTLYPSGQARPLAANLNFVAAQTVPNLVVVKVGADGKVAIFNQAGSTDVIADVAGYYSDASGGLDGRYTGLVPARIADSRDGTGGAVRLGPGASMDLQVAEAGGVPASGAEAATMNVAVTGTDATSFLTVYPTGAPRPLAANLNWTAGLTVSNRAMVKLGTGGKVTVFNNAGSTDVIVDVNGWYTDASVAGSTGAYNALTPARILDTRDGTGGVSGPLAAGANVDVQVTGRGGVPASGVTAVILNVAVTQPAGQGYLTISPTGSPRPVVSDLNYAPGETRSNLVVVRVGTGGKVNLFTQTGTHVIFDVAGWFS